MGVENRYLVFDRNNGCYAERKQLKYIVDADVNLNLDAIYKRRLPEIKYLNIIVPDKVVEATFVDHTKEKSVCREPDVFSLEQAISICLCKKLMGGSGNYNKAIKQAKKVYENKLKAEDDRQKEEQRIAKKREKRIADKMRRMQRQAEEIKKKKQAEVEEQIEIQKEAYLRAMRELSN